MLEVTVETNFKDVAKKCQRAGDKALLEIDKEMNVIGERIAAVAQEIASQHNPSIKVTKHVVPGAVEIIGSSGDSPIAVLEELGNKNKRKGLNTFRHPVFGNREVFVEQPKHRYLQPALTANRAYIKIRMEGALSEALMAEGFEVI